MGGCGGGTGAGVALSSRTAQPEASCIPGFVLLFTTTESTVTVSPKIPPETCTGYVFLEDLEQVMPMVPSCTQAPRRWKKAVMLPGVTAEAHKKEQSSAPRLWMKQQVWERARAVRRAEPRAAGAVRALQRVGIGLGGERGSLAAGVGLDEPFAVTERTVGGPSRLSSPERVSELHGGGFLTLSNPEQVPRGHWRGRLSTSPAGWALEFARSPSRAARGRSLCPPHGAGTLCRDRESPRSPLRSSGPSAPHQPHNCLQP